MIILALYNMEQVGSTMPERYAGSMIKRWTWLTASVSILVSVGAGLVFSAYNPLYSKKLFDMVKHLYSPFMVVAVTAGFACVLALVSGS